VSLKSRLAILERAAPPPASCRCVFRWERAIAPLSPDAPAVGLRRCPACGLPPVLAVVSFDDTAEGSR
jgi:hypothetical protein